MPRGDRTGPEGRGPMTGRGAGFCAGYDSPGFMNPMAGVGFGRRGRAGGGRGWRHRFNATGMTGVQGSGYSYQEPSAPTYEPIAAQSATKETEISELKNRILQVENMLTELNNKLDKIGK